jgi:hypothetical protein
MAFLLPSPIRHIHDVPEPAEVEVLPVAQTGVALEP